MAHEVGNSAQRIRYGLTGLALAFLIVLVGSIISKASHDGPSNAAQQQATANEPNEPLAELGVAPGGSSDTTNNVTSKKK